MLLRGLKLDKSSVRYKEIRKTSGKILNIYDAPDSWFWIHASINPYRGCEHNCVYCDGRAEYYRIDQFSSLIRVKTDASLKFEKELLSLGFSASRYPSLDNFISSSKEKGKDATTKEIFIFAIGGGVCDVYQPAERTFKITRRLLKVARDFNAPISIITKNKLVERDLDLIKEINQQNYANICFSITLWDDNQRKIFEPHSSSTNDRFNALKIMRKNKIHGGVMLMPILPGVGDNEENIRKIIKKSKEIGSEFILGAGLTLKPGKNKQKMITTLERHYPDLLPLYSELYGENNKYGSPDFTSSKCINGIKLTHEYCQKYNIPDRIPRYIPMNPLSKNYVVGTILHNLAHYYLYVRGFPRDKIAEFVTVAKKIEKHNSPIEEYSKSKLISLFTSNNDVLEVIHEVLQTGKSTALSQFQKPEDVFIEEVKLFS